MKTKLSAGVAPTRLKNARYAKSDCTVIKIEYFLSIDHLFHKKTHSISVTRIHQLKNPAANQKLATKILLCAFKFVPYYFQILYFYP